jgi:Family of unknown function (DUF6527)
VLLPDERLPGVELGDGHTLHWVGWAPDRGLNPQYATDPDEPRWGAIVEHPRSDGSTCEGGYIQLDGPLQRRVRPDRPMWQVTSWEPLTLTPSLLCGACGDHGWIRAGAWIRS